MEQALAPPSFLPSHTEPSLWRWATQSVRDHGLALVLTLGMTVAIIAGVAWGAVVIPTTTVVGVISAHLGIPVVAPYWTVAQDAIIWQVRLPRVLGAALAGASLATSGALFQGLFRNPMADPFVLGISSGAAFGATVALLLGPMMSVGLLAANPWGASAATLEAFVLPASGACGAICAAFLVYRMARRGASFLLTDLLLAGFAVGSLLSAGTTALLVTNDQMVLRLRLVFAWLAGGIAVNGWSHLGLVAPFMVVGVLGALALSRWLDPLVLGETGAASVGVPIALVTRLTLTIGALLAAVAVTLGGLIGFVGLLVPHGLRRIAGPAHRRLLPACVVGGAMFLVVADLLARIVIAPVELPVGVLTALLGAPVFLVLLRRTRRGGLL